MDLDRKLLTPITLDDGRTLVTLREAVEFALRLPELHQRNHHWQYAAEALQAAAQPRAGKQAMILAEQRLRGALEAEGALNRVKRPIRK